MILSSYFGLLKYIIYMYDGFGEYARFHGGFLLVSLICDGYDKTIHKERQQADYERKECDKKNSR